MMANRKWKWAVRTGSSRSGKVVYDTTGDYELPMNSGTLTLIICLFVHERQLELGDYLIKGMSVGAYLNLLMLDRILCGERIFAGVRARRWFGNVNCSKLFEIKAWNGKKFNFSLILLVALNTV